MSEPLQGGDIVVKPSSIQGYGVFAAKDFKVGDIVEECYTLEMANNSKEFIDYSFEVDGTTQLPLGFGSIYNHATEPHLKYFYNKDKKVMIMQAIRPIKMGEEIFISYGKEWFSERKIPMRQIRSSNDFSFEGLKSTVLRFAAVVTVIVVGITYLTK